MACTWLSIHVELIEGGGRTLWPRPGRVFAAARSHTFAQLADAIDTAFARWDRSHLCLFELADGTQVSGPMVWEDPWEDMVFTGDVRLSRLRGGEQLLYTFDMGDGWTHLCTVAEQRVDPVEALGIVPDAPLAYWGWGEMPDQYGRRAEDDDGETPLGRDPQLADLPPLRPHWGQHPTRPRQQAAVWLQDVEDKLLAAAVALAPPDRPLPDSGTATLTLCGALAPLADGVRRHASPMELRDDVAQLGGAAATFLIALTTPGPSPAQLDSARRHVIVAVLHGSRGISRIPADELDGEQWMLHAVSEIAKLMAEGSTGPPVTEAAYTLRVTAHALQVLAICGAWLMHHQP